MEQVIDAIRECGEYVWLLLVSVYLFYFGNESRKTGKQKVLGYVMLASATATLLLTIWSIWARFA